MCASFMCLSNMTFVIHFYIRYLRGRFHKKNRNISISVISLIFDGTGCIMPDL